MKLRVLGCAGAELPGYRPPGFLLDDRLMLDAGTICAALDDAGQRRIRHIIVTHSHLDHIRGIPVLADNLFAGNARHSVVVAGCRETLDAIRAHLMNDILWPDFSRLPSPDAPVVRYLELAPEQETMVDGYSVTPVPVNHPVPAVGYLVRKEGSGLIYTGDTGPTERIWRYARDLTALIIEVSFPNEMESVAVESGHLTPRLLARELRKMANLPPRVLITHPKPLYFSDIEAELLELGIEGMEMLRDGSCIDL